MRIQSLVKPKEKFKVRCHVAPPKGDTWHLIGSWLGNVQIQVVQSHDDKWQTIGSIMLWHVALNSQWEAATWQLPHWPIWLLYCNFFLESTWFNPMTSIYTKVLTYPLEPSHKIILLNIHMASIIFKVYKYRQSNRMMTSGKQLVQLCDDTWH